MRMCGRLRDIARATHRCHLLIWHVEAGSVKLSVRAGAIGMDSSLTQSFAGAILPGELTDFPNPRTNSHIERGRLQGNRPSSGQTPNKNVGNPRFKTSTTEAQNGKHRPISASATNSRTNPGHHRTPSHDLTNSHAKPGLHHPPAHLKTISRNHPGFAPPANALYPRCLCAPRPDTTKNRTPKWACGRCTIELPGPSPAFDA